MINLKININNQNTKMALLAAAGVLVLTGTIYNFGYLKSFFVKTEPKSEIEMDIIQTSENEESSDSVEVSEPVVDVETKVHEEINTDE